ncbi:MAG: hypothetical protein JNK15_23310 [Planctomycetes bacterium]|nr:hypothetical protein [Planctomycetota bacterium]
MDTYDFFADPRAIGLAERRIYLRSMQREQQWWLDRLQALTEPPRPEADFPAFLLATPPFHDLARKLARAGHRSHLAPAVADELDWFVRAFRDYLRTCDGEDVFSSAHRGSPER